MPADLDALAADLGAETTELLRLLEPLDAAGWATPTPAPGWRIQEQIADLAYFDEAAATAARDADVFQRELEAALADPAGITERISARSRRHAAGGSARLVPRRALPTWCRSSSRSTPRPVSPGTDRR